MVLKCFSIVIGVLIAITGILSIVFSELIVHFLIESNMKLDPSTLVYQEWLNPPIDIYMSFYVFNLKNPQSFLKGEKPEFEEIGPIVYKQYISREEINDNLNYTISYKQRKLYKFVPSLSAYDESFPITTVNLAPISLAYNLKYQPDTLVRMLNMFISRVNESIIITRPINELLFGYKDNLLEFLKKFNIFDHNLVQTDIIGLFFNKNNTIDGVYTIYTGVDDSYKIGKIQRYNYNENLNIWSSPYANMINGTDGTMFGPFIDKTKPLYVFNTDVCRSLYVKYNETVKSLNEIELLGYKPDVFLFADNKTNPDNNGFCTPAGNCLGSGVLNISNCLKSLSPIIVSNPHFLNADSKYSDAVLGLKSNVTKHTTSVYIEQITGTPFTANLKMQINVNINRDTRISLTSNLPEILFPLYWCDENFKIDQKTADMFTKNVLRPLNILKIGKYVILSAGLILIILPLIHSVVLILRRRKMGYRNIDDVVIVNEDERNFES